ncbi:thiamine pyrophosphate-binding protein [Bosea sp. RAF48]|uniref:thiamine pyrophosphate-binding protein n=1 Tax=Bosea sp. RAF48 TaxID=3237480 RepID=UPI003F8F8272
MRGTGGALLYATLKSHGVRCLFGMEDPIHVFHAVDRSFTRIVTVRDEKHAAIMAHGYAQVTGRPGVCAATFGPGATNLITGLLEAQRSSVPVIALVQDHALRLKNKHASSALDHAVALGPYVKEVIRIDMPEQAGDAVRKAFRIATTGRPGPVVLLCPGDVMAAEAEAETWADPAYAHFPANRVRASRESIAGAAQLLAGARRPLLIAGGGSIISGAEEEIRILAELFDMPVATTMTGRGAIPDTHPLAAGPLGSTTGGRYGRGRISNTLFAEADVVFVLGSRTGQICYSDWSLPKPGTKLIHLDIDPAEIGRNFATDVAMVGDIRDTLRDLLAHCAEHGLARTDAATRERLNALTRAWREEFRPVATSGQTPIRPERLLAEISARTDEKTLIVTDASYVTGWAMSHIDVPGAGRFILSPRGTGGIGWSLPAAIGAKMADPSLKVVCVTGDGAFGYVFNELETAARYGVEVLVVVFNNGTLGFQRHWEQKAMGRYLECDFLDIDFGELGRALKCKGERITDPTGIADGLARGQAAGAPYVLDVVIDPDATAPIVGFETILAADAVH